MHFLNPAKGGDTLIYKAAVNRSWNSSMEIGIQVQAENSIAGTTKNILSAYFTFVAVDEHNNPVAIPAVKPESSEEHMRYKEAQFRREQRLKTGELRKKLYT
jgi:acyl-CoA hydrolase